MSDAEFQEFPKLARLSREMIVSEKIDGTNSQILITESGELHVGSRSRWLSQKEDNFGFWRWVIEHQEEIRKLGPGRHFGEWWGSGIQRGYGLKEKRFSLFNVSRWTKLSEEVEGKKELAPECCHVIPVLFAGPFDTGLAVQCLSELAANGSKAAPGYMNPEGIIVWHTAGNFGLKKTIHKDEQPKSLK